MPANRSEVGRDKEAYFLNVLHGAPGVIPSLLRTILTPLSWLYELGLELYLLQYKLGLRKRYKLPKLVISVGNLTTGGTGKTPFTVALCKILQSEGRSPAVLSRGYKGEHERGCAVVSDGDRFLLNAAEAGDEAFMLASLLREIPIVVGKDRRQSGKMALAQFDPDLIVMDDGMQYWQLHRDMDIVLLDASKPFDNGFLLPRGLLREPARHLRRAHIIIITRIAPISQMDREKLLGKLRDIAPGKPIFTADLVPYGIREIFSSEVLPPSWLKGRRVSAYSGIGNPESFENMLGELGAVNAHQYRLPDHAKASEEEFVQFVNEAKQANAELIITTEKDAVKMTSPAALPIYTLQVKMQMDFPDAFLRALKEGLNRS